MVEHHFSNLLGDPFWVVSIAMSCVGWVVAFAGSVINEIKDPKRFPIFCWWGLAFQLLIILLLSYSVVVNRLHMYRLALLAFLALSTVYTTNSTNNFVWRHAATAGIISAGQILMSIINILWMFYLGTSHDEPVHNYVASFAAAKYPSRESHDYYRHTGRGMPSMYGSRGGTASGAYSGDIASGRPYSTAQFRGAAPGVGPTGHSGAMYSSADHQQGQNGRGSQLNYGGRPLSVLSGSTDQSDSLSLPTEYPYKARALYSYTANPEDDNEITFEKDEVLEISDITGRWWQARRANGEVGICPSNYVVLL